jgi:hypothetical protein
VLRRMGLISSTVRDRPVRVKVCQLSINPAEGAATLLLFN